MNCYHFGILDSPQSCLFSCLYSFTSMPILFLTLFVTCRETVLYFLPFKERNCQHNICVVMKHFRLVSLKFDEKIIFGHSLCQSFLTTLYFSCHLIISVCQYDDEYYFFWHGSSWCFTLLTEITNGVALMFLFSTASKTIQIVFIKQQEEVRLHFGCPTLEGAELEDQGEDGTLLTHWEKRVFEVSHVTLKHA